MTTDSSPPRIRKGQSRFLREYTERCGDDGDDEMSLAKAHCGDLIIVMIWSK
eukprot:SAG11_NODE_4_length_33019_cov_28.098909_3_plen_52_part_00